MGTYTDSPDIFIKLYTDIKNSTEYTQLHLQYYDSGRFDILGSIEI